MIYDKEFLLKLNQKKEREIYAQITALTFQETPIEVIRGRITTGSINVDGNSAVRRTCSLTVISEDFDYSNYYWGLNTQFKLEVGLKNRIDPTYPDIIWFPQGIFILTSFNTSSSANSFQISIQGKDKMSLLNGEVGGSLESSIDFGTVETVSAHNYITISKIPIYEIIRNMIHEYAGEPYHNIIIKDLDTLGLELMEYRYDTPMYLYREPNSNIYKNVLFNGATPCIVDGVLKTLDELGPEELDILVDPLMGSTEPKIITIQDKAYYVAKVEYGQTAGYRATDLTYAGDLIGNIGETITSVLDKIKNMLSDFEYFYNVLGQFVFQRKQTYVNIPWTPIIDETYVENLAYASEYLYKFYGSELISSFNNNPNLLNLRNDYSIWGVRGQIPIHMRYAIDVKPIQYTCIVTNQDGDAAIIEEYNQKYNANLQPQTESITYTTENYDWREIIYQMAQDYFKYGHLFDDFEQRLGASNRSVYPSGRTGYEQYYTDISSFWRELYDPNPEEDKKNDYFSESEQYKYWNKNVYEAPEKLNF